MTSVVKVWCGEFYTQCGVCLEWWMSDADVADVLFTNGVVNVWYSG